MIGTIRIIFAVFATALLISACGGGGGSSSPPTPTSHTVNISWAANRETAVNSAGGGYTVAISGQPPINLPYVSGVAAPTTMNVALMSGSYSVLVKAYSALNPPGGTTGSTSAPSTTFNFSVPY